MVGEESIGHCSCTRGAALVWVLPEIDPKQIFQCQESIKEVIPGNPCQGLGKQDGMEVSQ